MLVALQDRQIFATVINEAAESIEELHLWARNRICWVRRRQRAPNAARGGRPDIAGAFDLVGQRSVIAIKHRAGACVKQALNFRRNDVGAQREHRPARIVAHDPGHRLVHPHQRLERNLKVLNTGRGALVQNHEIDRQSLQPPVFVCSQQLADEIKIMVLLDSDQQDGQVT